jgi:hypothetical protein
MRATEDVEFQVVPPPWCVLSFFFFSTLPHRMYVSWALGRKEKLFYTGNARYMEKDAPLLGRFPSETFSIFYLSEHALFQLVTVSLRNSGSSCFLHALFQCQLYWQYYRGTVHTIWRNWRNTCW